jgi:hypothetical protein
MLDFSQTNVVKLAITWSGNKELNEGVLIPSTTLVSVNEYVHEILVSGFLKPFEKLEEFFYFTDNEDVSNNETYQSCMKIFENPESISDEAAKLTNKIYSLSTNPKVKGGEFFVVLFDGINFMGEDVPAIGIFKIIQKDAYLRVERSSDAFALGVMEGIPTGKLAMAALVFGVDEAEGYRMLTFDTVKKKDETSMWLEQFLKVKPIEDNYFNTRHYMAIASEFINEKAPAKFGLNTPEKIDLLNRSSFYFKENEHFELEDFSKALFEEEEHREVFKEFKEEFARYNSIPLEEQFDISKKAVSKTSRVFKNVIQLDENFQIHVQGRRDLIERGFDEEKGKPFYKIYFEKEE